MTLSIALKSAILNINNTHHNETQQSNVKFNTDLKKTQYNDTQQSNKECYTEFKHQQNETQQWQ
jgi:hypothetical protein